MWNDVVLSLSHLPCPTLCFSYTEEKWTSSQCREGSLNTVQRSKLPNRAEKMSFGCMPLLGAEQNKHMENESE